MEQQDRRDASRSGVERAQFIAAVESLQRRSVEQGTDEITMDEIDDEIRAVRRARAE